jgi:ABC-type multidrug transport system ATPase subunit
MKTLARSGKTIICVIHQPSSTIFEMFDHLYLLAKGQCIYQGAITDVVRNISATTGVMCPNYHNPVSYFRHLSMKFTFFNK